MWITCSWFSETDSWITTGLNSKRVFNRTDYVIWLCIATMSYVAKKWKKKKNLLMLLRLKKLLWFFIIFTQHHLLELCLYVNWGHLKNFTVKTDSRYTVHQWPLLCWIKAHDHKFYIILPCFFNNRWSNLLLLRFFFLKVPCKHNLHSKDESFFVFPY